MSLPPIITSLLDTDLYKFTMLQVYLHQFPGASGEYRFLCRSVPGKPLALLKTEIENQLDHLCTLRFRPDELDFLRTLRFMKSDFVDYLELFHFLRRFVSVNESNEANGIEIVAKGPLMQVMLFEIFVLAIVSEVYYTQHDWDTLRQTGRQNLTNKISLLEAFGREPARKSPYVFFEFGTRRRASRLWHEEVVSTLADKVPQFFKGTSNVDLARRYNLVPIGTMAHEYLQVHQALGYRLRDFQKMALENWVREYRGDLGIALTDVITTDAFLADFDLYFAKLFDGLRHDSGDPVAWGEQTIDHYRKLRLDPATKMLVFSDALDLPRSFELYRRFADRTRTGFGIGTNLTNDVGVAPLNIVMKLAECNGNPVAKISDEPGKTMCDDQTFLAYLRQVFNVGNGVHASAG